jgi:membrane protease YdiL (CAAX protease family)
MITNTTHDHSLVAGVKGNWKAFIQWILIVWLFVALLEEGLFRGFLMTEISKIIGNSSGALLLNILFTSIVFGLSHGYQGRGGALSTGIVGVVLGSIFVLSEFNLWLAIFTHGFIDTVGIGLIAVDGDKYIRRMILKGPN